MNTTRLPSLFAPEPFMLDEPFRSFMRQFRWEPMPEAPQIPMDLNETDAGYVVTATLPGVKKEDIHVEIDGRQVMISTEFKKPPVEKKDQRSLRSELSWGFASRSFTLPHEIDRAKADAKYVDGVLTLTLPKLMPAHVEPLKVQ
jgi:HSP20 family protein